MHDTDEIEITLLTGSLGPHRGADARIARPAAGTLPPVLIEDPAPGFEGQWRRVSGSTGPAAYVRVPRLAAP